MKRGILGVTASMLALTAMVSTESPYAGQERREIKALSAQEIEDFLGGAGMGYARAAELNRYPGPRHVLELASELVLTDGQAAGTRDIHAAMQSRAAALGAQLVSLEQELDRQFADESITAESLRQLVADIGALQAEIRYVHLSAHLEQTALLTREQAHRYVRLRGYGSSGKSEHARHGAGHERRTVPPTPDDSAGRIHNP